MNLADTLINAADAPGLRQRIAELEAVVTHLTAENKRLTVENARLAADYEFYLCAFCEKPVAHAEQAWGVP